MINNVSLNFLVFYTELREKSSVKYFAPFSSSTEILRVDVNFTNDKEATLKLAAAESEVKRRQ